MEIGELVLISNLLITMAFFLATLYRIKIEREEVEAIVKNARAAERLRRFCATVKMEEDLIKEMSGEQLLKFLKSEICEDIT